MRRLLLLLGCGLLAHSAVCGGSVPNAPERTPLWPEGKIPHFQETQIAAIGNPYSDKGFVAKEHRMPFLEWCTPPAESNRTGAVAILVSGGAYKRLCDVWLLELWRRSLTAAGVQCALLGYRSPRPEGLPIYQSAWEDGQRAVRVVRSEAKARGYDPDKVIMFGMSAGAHLTALLATSSRTPAYEKVDALDDIPCNLNAACTYAIAYGMTDGLTGQNTRAGLTDAQLDGIFKFDAATCPMWMSHGGNDPYSPSSSVEVYRRLRAMKVPAELHLVPGKGHGAHAFHRAFEFLRQLGFLRPEGRSQRLDERFTFCREILAHSREEIGDESTPFCPYIEWHSRKSTTGFLLVALSPGSNTVDRSTCYGFAPLWKWLGNKCRPTAVLHYRENEAQKDVSRGLAQIRKQAEARGFSPRCIGVLGIRKGADLALRAAADKSPDAKANWAVAVSPTDAGCVAPDAGMSPVLILHGDAEGAAVGKSLDFWQNARRAGVQSQFDSVVGVGENFATEALPGTGGWTWFDRILEIFEYAAKAPVK